MNNMRYGEGLQVVPLLSSAATDSTVSAFVNVDRANWLSFLIGLGANDTTTTITVQCCTANSTTGATLVQIPFRYRVSGEMGADSWSAISTADTAGYALDSDHANCSILVDIDPQDLAANSELSADYKYVRVGVACTSYGAANPITVTAFPEPRYRRNSPLSAS